MRRDVQDKGEFIWITLPNTKTKITREFAITDGNIQGISCLDLFRKYMDLRPSQTKHDRFFLTYRGGKCTQQPVGVNTIGGIPKNIVFGDPQHHYWQMQGQICILSRVMEAGSLTMLQRDMLKHQFKIRK
jgi:hypothetical protein